MDKLLAELIEQLNKMDKRFDDMEKRMGEMTDESRKQFAHVNEKLDRIEKKIGAIPPTYEEHEKILGRHGLDIELIKKLILNQ